MVALTFDDGPNPATTNQALDVYKRQTYDILTGAAKGTQVFGQDPLWLAWVTDLVNLKGTDASHYQQLLDTCLLYTSKN